MASLQREIRIIYHNLDGYPDVRHWVLGLEVDLEHDVLMGEPQARYAHVGASTQCRTSA